VSTELSLSRDRNLIVQIQAEENVLSASTDVGQTVNKYEYTVSKQEPRYPVLLNKQVAIGLVSQEWKKAVATCSMVARGLRIVTVSVWLNKSFLIIYSKYHGTYAVFNWKIQFFSMPKSRYLGFANPGIWDPGITIPISDILAANFSLFRMHVTSNSR